MADAADQFRERVVGLEVLGELVHIVRDVVLQLVFDLGHLQRLLEVRAKAHR